MANRILDVTKAVKTRDGRKAFILTCKFPHPIYKVFEMEPNMWVTELATSLVRL